MSASGVRPDAPPTPASTPLSIGAHELVVCSLESWDEVWRRNQFFVDALLTGDEALRVLFVEPPADPLFDLASRRRPALARARRLRADGRLQTLRPLKPLPRRLGSFSDRALQRKVIDAARRLRFTRPTLWLNDVTYAPLIARTGWPAVYDVTDDWLLAPLPPRELARLRRLDELALAQAGEVVVCSPALAAHRGAHRAVTLIPNGVDREHFRRPRPRPRDLPEPPVAVYVGTLNEARLDVELVVELADSLPALSVVLVGPDGLAPASRRVLATRPNVRRLGPRPYADVPAYLQHAQVIVVPHVVTPFTETLDPIKAYECLAVETPTVATAVAGFRELEQRLCVVERGSFVAAVGAALGGERAVKRTAGEPPAWSERAAAFARVLDQARLRDDGGTAT